MDKIYEAIKKLAESEYQCPHCNATFEDDDFAYLQETGLCQYCHKDIRLDI